MQTNETNGRQERQRPKCPLIGADGNIFNLMAIASRTLRKNGMADAATEMCSRIHQCESYDHALCIIGEYVHITSVGYDSVEESENAGDI